jgi:very-short-patch-repair endonuclease
VVARAQLRELGFGRRAIGHRLESGRLHRVHRAVYAVGHRLLSPDGRWMAAVLAGGSGAVLSHRSAAALWRIRSTARPRVEITVPRGHRSRPGIDVHHSSIPPDEVTGVRGIPVTTVPPTLIDLAAVVDGEQVVRAAREAEVLRLCDLLSLEDLTARHPRRPGKGAIKAALAAGGLGSRVTRSELEGRFARFLKHAGLPPAEVNARVALGGRELEVDYLWRERRLVVELDGHAAHGTRAAFERDRLRDRRLQAAGWRVIRLTWGQLDEAPGAVASDLRALLQRPHR